MSFTYRIVLSGLCLLLNPALASNPENLGFSDSYTLGSTPLQRCNATNIKAMLFIDVGDAALYLQDCTTLATETFMLAMRYNRPFTADEFRESSTILIQRNVPDSQYSAIKTAMESFNTAYRAVEIGDEYRISYIPEYGLELRKNGLRIAQSKNPDLAQAYFKVWFGERPFNKGMKKDLLRGLN